MPLKQITSQNCSLCNELQIKEMLYNCHSLVPLSIHWDFGFSFFFFLSSLNDITLFKLDMDFSCHTATWQEFCDVFWTLCVLFSLLISGHAWPAGAFLTCHRRLSAIVTFNYSFSACHHRSASARANEVTSSLHWLAVLAWSREQVLQPEIRCWAQLTGIMSTVQ